MFKQNFRQIDRDHIFDTLLEEFRQKDAAQDDLTDITNKIQSLFENKIIDANNMLNALIKKDPKQFKGAKLPNNNKKYYLL